MPRTKQHSQKSSLPPEPQITAEPNTVEWDRQVMAHQNWEEEVELNTMTLHPQVLEMFDRIFNKAKKSA